MRELSVGGSSYYFEKYIVSPTKKNLWRHADAPSHGLREMCTIYICLARHHDGTNAHETEQWSLQTPLCWLQQPSSAFSKNLSITQDAKHGNQPSRAGENKAHHDPVTS